MANVKAVYHALDLLNRPILAGVMQEQPLPPDTLTLLKIVAGEDEALASTALATSQPRQRIRQASILYVQRILFAPDADHYRVLGAERDAPQEELRERLALLMRWLHPDRTRNDWESAFAKRVLAAWDALKSPERRRHYDATLPPAFPAGRSPRTQRPRIHRPARRIPWIWTGPTAPAGKGARVGLITLGGAIAIAAILVPDWTGTPPRATSVEPETAHVDAVAGSTKGREPIDPASGGP